MNIMAGCESQPRPDGARAAQRRDDLGGGTRTIQSLFFPYNAYRRNVNPRPVGGGGGRAKRPPNPES